MTAQGSSRRGGGRRWTAAAFGVLAAIGAVLLVLSLTNQVGAPPQPEPRSGAGEASDSGGARSDATTSPDPSAAEDPTASGTTEQPDTEAASEASAAPLAASEPVSLTIDSIGVEEELFPIGLGPDGQLLAPRGDRANLPAWFEGSPTPGESGPSVIEGHVTWGGDPSVFFELGALTSGDRIEVEREDGTVATFEVYDSARFAKDDFPTLDVYGRTAGPELRLITCSGDLGSDGHHLDNTVVFARLVES